MSLIQLRLRPAAYRATALTLAVCLLTATGAAAETGARLRFDFAAGVVEVAVEKSQVRADLPLGLGPRMAAFRASLARGIYDRDEASSLGQALLSPVADELRDKTAWEITPLEAAPVGALLAPWDPERAILHRVTIWYRPAGVDPRELEPVEEAPVPGDGRGVLSIAPFRDVTDPRADSPDTLLAVFRATAKTLDQVPRNDTTVEAITGALHDHRYALVWLRADPSQVSPLLAPLGHGTHVLWWSRPIDAEGTEDGSMEAVFAPVERWTAGGRTMLVDLWPCRETALAPGVEAMVGELAKSATWAQAVAAGRRAVASAAGSSPRDWAGWILVGDGQRSQTWKKPGWLQRWLRR